MNRVNIPQKSPALPTARVSENDLAMAYAMGDPRMNAKELDRAGLSRGGAQMNQAGINAAQKMASGIADAYSNQLKNQTLNANAQLAMDQGREQYGQALGGLQQQAAYANQMANLQRQGALLGLLG